MLNALLLFYCKRVYAFFRLKNLNIPTFAKNFKVVPGNAYRWHSLFILNQMLHKIRPLIIIVSILFVVACSGSRHLVELTEDANQAYKNQEYAQALALYEEYIYHFGNDAMSIPDSIYLGAGLAAFELGQTDKAIDYLHPVRSSESAGAQAQYALAVSNREIDNLSREITALETYVNNHPEGDHIESMRNRLFETYVESRNYDKALDLWPDLSGQAKEQESMINLLFVTHRALDNESEMDALAHELIEKNPDNVDALEYLAQKYFWKAENRYQEEMKAYENNRTHSQYAQLLRAFDVLNEDFRTSLNYYLRLYEFNPKAEYARFIGNIYLRFDDENKAQYYHDKANE